MSPSQVSDLLDSWDEAEALKFSTTWGDVTLNCLEPGRIGSEDLFGIGMRHRIFYETSTMMTIKRGFYEKMAAGGSMSKSWELPVALQKPSDRSCGRANEFDLPMNLASLLCSLDCSSPSGPKGPKLSQHFSCMLEEMRH